MINKYERLKEFCSTDRQRELIDALVENNKVKKAAHSIDMSERGAFRMLATIKKRQSASGKGDHFIANNNIPEGLAVKGTSTLYKDGEPSIQWVKTDRTAKDPTDKWEALKLKPLL